MNMKDQIKKKLKEMSKEDKKEISDDLKPVMKRGIEIKNKIIEDDATIDTLFNISVALINSMKEVKKRKNSSQKDDVLSTADFLIGVLAVLEKDGLIKINK